MSGPLLRDKLYLSQSAEYRLNKSPVFTLPFPENESWHERWNSLTQVDGIVSATHTVTATVHVVPQKVNWANLSFYTPRPAAPSFRAREFHAGATDRMTVGGGVLESAWSASEVTGRTTPHGFAGMTLTPVRNLGNYFAAQDRRARRYQWLESYTVTRGAHTWKAGASAIRGTLGGWFAARPLRIEDGMGAVQERIEFVNRPGYGVGDVETGVYGQDHWQIRPNLSLDAGLRADWQRIASALRIGPRLGMAWAPFGDASTVFRGGYGWYYDRVPLSVYAFAAYPERVVDGMRLTNRISNGGQFQPRSRNWQAQVEHRFGAPVRVRASYLESRSEGLVVLSPGASWLALEGSGRARYRQLEVISQVSLWEGQDLFVSYVRSAGRGNLNEFAEWLGDFPGPVIRPDVFATAPANMPHRLLAWGVVPFNARTRLAPVIEYRTGLPYAALDARQQYAGEPFSRRFPNFLSVDFRVARDIPVRGHAVQVSFSMFNVTNHWNPDAVRWNVADPQFGEFLGQHPRRFRLDFDFLF